MSLLGSNSGTKFFSPFWYFQWYLDLNHTQSTDLYWFYLMVNN